MYSCFPFSPLFSLQLLLGVHTLGVMTAVRLFYLIQFVRTIMVLTDPGRLQ